MPEKQLHVLCIGGHIGDMELTAGAVVAKYTQEGHKATILALTPGEKGHPTIEPDAYAKQKIEESRRACAVLGADTRFLEYKDAELPVNDEVKYAVCDVIREIRPDIIITHWKGSMHKDHMNTYYIVKDAIFYAGLKTIRRELPESGPVRLFFADNWEDPYGFSPTVFVDISKSRERWIEAMEQFAYARGETSDFDFVRYYKALSIVRAQPVGLKYAQAFMESPRQQPFAGEHFPM